MNRDEIIEALRQADADLLEQWYRGAYPYTAEFVLSNEGGPDEARRCFRRALSLFFRLICDKTLPAFDCTPETYLYALSRALWLQDLKHKGRAPSELNTAQPETPLPHIDPALLQAPVLPAPPTAEMVRAMEQLRPEYRNFLVDYYFQKRTYAEIAEQFDYSESYARVKKKRCLDELRRLLHQPSAPIQPEAGDKSDPHS